MATTDGTLHLLVGPVAAGKTTYAKLKIAQSPALLLDVDASMVRLFGADPRPPDGVIAWYLERRERCRGLLWDIARSALRCGCDVFLELGLVTRTEREEAYRRAQLDNQTFVVHLIDAPRSVRRERVASRNLTPTEHTQIVPLEMFERASDAWEPPSSAERTTWGLVDVCD